MGRLFTNEDPVHVHKTLGACALAHFAYRFGSLATRGTMRLDDSVWDVALVVCHAALSLSSLIFRLPARRHEQMPMIYPEFRAHSIIFALRSVACCVLAMYGASVWIRAAACFLCMMAADAATARYTTGTTGTTMRAMPFPSDLADACRRAVTFYHSVSQAHATAFMMLDADAAFAPLLAIQLAAFLMTLVRKGLISTTTWHGAYTASLAVCVLAVSGSDFVWVSSVGACFVVARMWLGAPKYLVWALLLATRAVWPDSVVSLTVISWLESHAPVMRVGYLLCVAATITSLIIRKERVRSPLISQTRAL
jgi:hypothetical protein